MKVEAITAAIQGYFSGEHREMLLILVGCLLVAALAVALVGVASTRNGVINGVGAGLLLLVTAQMVVDHYSEYRAREYSQKLGESAPAL